MSCKCGIPTDEYHGWKCTVTGGACEFMFPSATACAEQFGEGPETEDSKCPRCKHRNIRIDKYPCNECDNDKNFEKREENK